ncbi:UPF0280 family protein [Sediminicoccus rosea]|jgi:ApbE superfamily uncharacterized protein (UPF0280 family)|uniref:UPF0280 family protein n=1 Tax=Sediminicoccus rosea TaxID=1225128 RepID=A0ABZ0PID7_9PROT|nr:UPF0280 family protein [Sediminicoccus rosea]WPB85385.1 UPF0280 family protein [Sediminicoccus rosea]
MTEVEWPPPRRALLPDGRLHLQDGPIDLVIGLEGARAAVIEAREAAWQGLHGVLPGLSRELALLRAPLMGRMPAFTHPVAKRMAEAAWPHRMHYVTPMVAVAGAVAEHVLRAIIAVPGISLAHVNNGGDIALHLSPASTLRVGLVEDPARPEPSGLAVIRGGDAVRGIATSGWRGRSFSRGIADAVTVLAARAPEADAAASIIANAVDVDHPAISRARACELDPDSDLRDLHVTVEVGALPEEAVGTALDAGERCAEGLLARGLILGACLRLQGRLRLVGAAGVLAAMEQVVVPP